MQDILKKIGDILGINKETKVENFEDVKTSDGNIVRIDKFEVGAKAELISADGTLIPLADAEYELEDGRKFSVKDGLISAIAEPTADPETEQPIQDIENTEVVESVEETPAEAPVEEVKAEITEERIAGIEAQIQELMVTMQTLMGYIEEMATSTNEFKAVKKQLEKEKEDLNKKVEDLEKTPAAESVTLSKPKETKQESKTSNTQKMWAEGIDYVAMRKSYLNSIKK